MAGSVISFPIFDFDIHICMIINSVMDREVARVLVMGECHWQVNQGNYQKV